MKTDKEGKAVFHFYDELGLKTFYVSGGLDLGGCSDHEFSIEEVLRAGR
jgi:hypothetical protein